MQRTSTYLQMLLGHWAMEHTLMGHGSAVTGCLIWSLACSPFSGRSCLPSLQQPARGHLLQGQRITVHCDNMTIVHRPGPISRPGTKEFYTSCRHCSSLQISTVLLSAWSICQANWTASWMLSPATSCHCSLPLPHRPTHSQPQYLLSWQSSKPSDGEAPQQSTGPVHFQHVPDRHQEVLQFHHRKPLPGTARTLALFVTDLSMNLQPGTIQAYISAVSYLHHMNGHRSPASNNIIIKLLVQSVERSMPCSSDPEVWL